uniref:YD repeat-containing protein n=1 Tax=Candidatus Kentrum sp. LFY TaxID=2126342 RepID=A0A450WAR6_9GAMM|nr:MAG: YD repeat-containing protein [Candidatus Kentron sp. LFY]
MTTSQTFYITGGTLPVNAPSYVDRCADNELFQTLKLGEFCYVLTSRQMGKSSLMVRTADRLRRDGVAVAVLDLTALGRNLTLEQWYDGLLNRLGRQLGLEDELEAFWQAHERLGPLQRVMQALRSVVLEKIQAPVVIFVDEIDVVRSLPFSSDEFFAAIRELFNARTESPELHRLTFCLLGVATPSDLIRDTRLTPFNIGKRIELDDFTAAESALLAQGLGRDLTQAAKLLERIYHWTNGHPYLSQRLCQAIAVDATITNAAGVDRACEELFLSSRARERDDNLLFVREQVLRTDTDHAALLTLYRRIHTSKKVPDDETNPLIDILRLAGLARVRENHLRVRNRIYGRAFDGDWIDANMPDAERRRQRAAFRRGLLRMGIAAGVVIACLIGGGWWYLDGDVWKHEAYYNTYVKRFGLPEGVGKLTKKQVRHRAVSLLFISEGRKNRPHTMMAVNSAGECTPRHGIGTYLKAVEDWETQSPLRECRWEFARDGKGNVVYEKAFDKEDRLVWGVVYSPDTEPDKAYAHYVGPDGYPMPQKGATAEFVEFTYSKEGHETLTRYTDREGRPATGLDRAYGRRQKYDDRGLVIEMVSLDPSDRPMIDEAGNSGQRLKYDSLGNLLEDLALDTEFEPVLLNDGWHKMVQRFDTNGNQIEQACFDTAGKPVLLKDGYHKAKYKYDKRGKQIEIAFFDTTGKPVLNKDGVHKWTSRYDERGNRIEQAYFDIAGKPVLHKDGYHKWITRYDEHGNQIELAYFDIAGKPVLLKSSYHKAKHKYDKHGNQIEIALFDTTGKPVLNKDGAHKWTSHYDERGNQIELAYFDAAGKPVLHRDGYHKRTARYDERGKLIELACFGTAEQPISFKNETHHRWTSRYDERGNQIERTYFGTDGQPVLHKDGYHKWTARYDERSNRVELAFFDIAGKPVLHKDGYHKSTARYDERGKQIEQAYFGTDNQPVSLKDETYHKWTARYDERGNQIELAYFGTAEQPVSFKNENHHKLTSRYDERGNQTGKAYFGTDGQPVLHKDGNHKWTARYDKHGNQIELAYFDAAGKPVLHRDGYHKSTARYDERGNRIEQAYFDIAGKPVLHKDGYHKWTARYDEHGNQIELAAFDATGQPKAKLTFRKDGTKSQQVIFTSDGHTSTKYNEREKQIEESYFDTSGEPMMLFDSYGYHKITFHYDEGGNRIEEHYFDTKGHQLVRSGITVISIFPDSQGEKLGIQPGDVIIQYDGQRFAEVATFIAHRETEPADGPSKILEVQRGADRLQFKIKPGKIGVELRTRFATERP